MQPRSSIKPLVEGAFAAALAAVLALVGLYVPLLSSIATLVWTVPISILIIRYSLREGLLALTVTGILVILLSNPLAAAFYLLQFGLVGIFFGLAFKRQIPAGYTVLGGIVISLLSTLTVSWLSLKAMGLSLSDLNQQITNTLEAAFSFYRSSGILEFYQARGITEDILREATEQMISLLKRLLPGLLAVGAAVTAGVNFGVVHLVARRLLLPIPKLLPFREWQMPWYLTWGVVLGFAGLLAGDYFKINGLMLVGQNLLLFYVPFLVLFGISVVAFYYHKSQLPSVFKIGLIILSCFYLSITLILVMVIGLFDPLFNYRKLTR